WTRGCTSRPSAAWQIVCTANRFVCAMASVVPVLCFLSRSPKGIRWNTQQQNRHSEQTIHRIFVNRVRHHQPADQNEQARRERVPGYLVAFDYPCRFSSPKYEQTCAGQTEEEEVH